MRKQCPRCGSREVYKVWDNVSMCLDCEKRFDTEDKTKQTVFQKITQSEETLAEKLVYHGVTSWDDEFYASTICNEIYKTRAEAIAATVAMLKEVAE